MEGVKPDNSASAASPARILIVDDNEINLAMLRLLLEAEGFEVVEASNGVEALEVARRTPVDLVITDVLMPEMDGFSLCRHWRADDGLRQVPLVVYTATYTEPQDMELAIGLGAVRFIVKPCDGEVMIAAVRELLVGSAEISQPPPPDEGLDEPTYYRKYSEALIRKLEDKMVQLEEANRALERTVDHVVRQRDRLRILTAALDGAASAIFIAGVDGRIEWVNGSFTAMTGYVTDEVIGRDPAFLDPVESGSTLHEEMWSTVRGGSSWRGRTTTRRRDGTTFAAETTLAPVRDGTDRIINFVAVSNDITHQLELERQLVRSKRMEAIGTLAGGLAHDFNNILQAMTSLAEAMEEECSENGDQRLEQLLAENRDLIDHGAHITRQLMTFSRSGRVRTDSLDLNRVVQDASGLLSRLAGDEVTIDLDLGDGVLACSGDRAQLEQVLVNLVVNGRDAMNGEGRLQIRTGGATEARVWLEIEDRGHGIDCGLESKIFEPLYTTKPEGKGTGLGLAVVRQVVERHGGAVRVESREGEGCCFRVELPRVDA